MQQNKSLLQTSRILVCGRNRLRQICHRNEKAAGNNTGSGKVSGEGQRQWEGCSRKKLCCRLYCTHIRKLTVSNSMREGIRKYAGRQQQLTGSQQGYNLILSVRELAGKFKYKLQMVKLQLEKESWCNSSQIWTKI